MEDIFNFKYFKKAKVPVKKFLYVLMTCWKNKLWQANVIHISIWLKSLDIPLFQYGINTKQFGFPFTYSAIKVQLLLLLFLSMMK